MNRIINSLLKKHREDFSLSNSDDSKSFEHFINYIVTKDFTLSSTPPLADMSLGKGELGIDGVAIICDGVFISSLEEIKPIFFNEDDTQKMGVSVSLIFTQSKTSESFDSGELNKFLTAVHNFLDTDNTIKLNANSKAKEFQEILDYIFDHCVQLAKNPDCTIIFAYTGNYSDNKDGNNLLNLHCNNIKKLNIIDNLKIDIYDAHKIQSIHNTIRNGIIKTIRIDDPSTMPSITNVDEAFIGTIKCKDYVDFISSEDGKIIPHIFEDNVRYYQGLNKVNREMLETIQSSTYQQAFVLLNNGVTIVAEEKIKSTRNDFTIKNFQIVNGCQTSFVLHENKDKLNDSSCIIVKIIFSKNKDIIDNIVKATNRQTSVIDEAFETLKEVHKQLEKTYLTYDDEYIFYYERRSKQYEKEFKIKKDRIISLDRQTKAYLAMFLENPHSTHRCYSDILKNYKDKMYQEDDVLEPYCISSMYVFFIEDFLRSRPNSNEYQKYKYHIALISRIILNSEEPPKRNDKKKMSSFCKELYENLKNKNKFEDSINKSITIVDKISKNYLKESNHPSVLSKYTESILEELEYKVKKIDKIKPLEENEIFKCRVLNWNRYFAYIEIIDHKKEGSIHVKNIKANGYIDDIGSVLSKDKIINAKIINSTPHPEFGYSMSMLI